MCVEVIVCYIIVVFLRHGVEDRKRMFYKLICNNFDFSLIMQICLDKETTVHHCFTKHYT